MPILILCYRRFNQQEQKRRTTLPAIRCHNGMASQQRRKLTQLDRCHLHAGLVRADALLFEHRRPTAELPWQEDDRRKLPARADRLAAFRQVRLVHYRAIRRGLRLRALVTSGIDIQQQRSSSLGRSRYAGKHSA